MRLEHQFTVNAPVDVVWQALLDPERVAPCMPGAALTSVEGSSFAGTVKVKLGPVSLQYKGSGEFTEIDESARLVKIKASGKDARGNGTAAADVTVKLSEKDGVTTGEVTTELAITGRPAQFGRGMIVEVGGKILDTFAGNLAKQLGETKPAAEPEQPKARKPAAAKPAPAKSAAAKPAVAADNAAAEPPAAKPAAARARTAAARKPRAQKTAAVPEPAEKPAAQKPSVAARPAQKSAAPEPPAEETVPAKKAAPAKKAPAAKGPVPSAPEAEAPVRKPVLRKIEMVEAEPIDLLEYAGSSVAKRLAPVIILGLVLLIFLSRRRRK